MPAVAKRTQPTPTPPAPASTRPAAKRAHPSATGAPVTHVRKPSTSVAPIPAGPAIKLKDPKAQTDPRFQKVMHKLQIRATQTKEHPPASSKAAEAQAAALPPANEKLSGAQAHQVDTMQTAEGQKPEESSFLALLRAEIAKVMPKTLGDTETFMQGEQKQQLKSAMTGNVDQQKEEASSDLKATSSQTPDPDSVAGKEVAPLPSEGTSPASTAIGARDALPAPKTEEEISLEQSKKDADQQLSDAEITPDQLRKANDPRFSAVLTTKSNLERQADSAPQQYQAQEHQTLTQEAAKAIADEKQGLAAFQAERSTSAVAVRLQQLQAKQKDEQRRQEVADTIEQIYSQTKQTVESKLASLESDVSRTFDTGIEAAMTTMTNYVNERMDAYKDQRYGVTGGSVLWAKDKLFGLPDEVSAYYAEGRTVFIQGLDRLIITIANLVEARLKEAKDEIARGQERIRDYVQSLPRDLQAVGKAAEKEVATRFDELRQNVDAKKTDLAQKLAQRYKEASDKADAQLKVMQEENKGLVTKLVEAVGEVVKILRDFKERITSMLKKGRDTIMLIVGDPIGFLGNLLSAVKQGIQQFVDNIWTHLKAGFLSWLFGSLAQAGIPTPSDFSLGSILKLVLQILGLTYDRIRAKASKLIGERNVMLIEKAWEVLSALITGGPAALWEMIKEYLGNLKEMVVNAIQDWVVTNVIKAAITKLATMFNPVGAIIQAVIAIYNTVMFFIERINQILALVEAIINSVHKIATGDISSAANWIEQAMARTIPVIIGFLARLLGLSGLTEKIKEIIGKLQSMVDKAVDKLIEKIVKGIGKLFKKDSKSSLDVKERWTRGMEAVNTLVEQIETESLAPSSIEKELAQIKTQYGFRELEIEPHGKERGIRALMNPTGWVPLQVAQRRAIVIRGPEGEISFCLIKTVKELGQIKTKKLRTDLSVQTDKDQEDSINRLMSKFKAEGITRQEAKEFVLTIVDLIEDGTLLETDCKPLLAYAWDAGKPVDFLTKVLNGELPMHMDAIDQPVSSNIRPLLVNHGVEDIDDPSTQRMSLSNFALVFSEVKIGHFVPSRSPSAGVREYQWLDERGERNKLPAQVFPLGVVEVGDTVPYDGWIIRIIAFHPSIPNGAKGLETIMRAVGWKVK